MHLSHSFTHPGTDPTCPALECQWKAEDPDKIHMDMGTICKFHTDRGGLSRDWWVFLNYILIKWPGWKHYLRTCCNLIHFNVHMSPWNHITTVKMMNIARSFIIPPSCSFCDSHLSPKKPMTFFSVTVKLFAFSKILYKYDHTICILLFWLLSLSIIRDLFVLLH